MDAPKQNSNYKVLKSNNDVETFCII